MTEQTKALLEAGKPWRRGAAWWIIGAEGAALAVVGIYVVADPDGARAIVRQIIGWFLLVNSVLIAAAGLRAKPPFSRALPYRMLSAGIGLAVGILVVVEPLSEFLTEDAARVILALGLLGHGLIALAGALVMRDEGGARRGTLLASGLYVLFAVLMFYDVRNDAVDPRWFGYAAIVAGILAMGFAYAVYRSTQSSKQAEEVLTTSAASPVSREDVSPIGESKPPAISETPGPDDRTPNQEVIGQVT